MLNFAANLTLLFTERPFLDRFAAAAAAGFKAVEFQFPYAWTRQEVATAAQTAGLDIVLFNLPAGNWEAGERGIACHPDRHEEFLVGITQAVPYAKALGCSQLNCLSGIKPEDCSDEEARSALVKNLRIAAHELAEADIGLLLEPINTLDFPGFFVNTPKLGLDIVREVGHDNLRLQYDIYHAQVSEGDLARTLAMNLDRIGHIQIADNPGRHEPGTGEINYPFLFRHLDAIGYRGWIGCEYRPAARTETGLGWLGAWR